MDQEIHTPSVIHACIYSVSSPGLKVMGIVSFLLPSSASYSLFHSALPHERSEALVEPRTSVRGKRFVNKPQLFQQFLK